MAKKMVWRIITHAAAMYLGAGLFGGMVMSTFLPLTNLGIAYYAVTWPEHIYCARPGNECAPVLSNLPVRVQSWMFDLSEDTPND